MSANTERTSSNGALAGVVEEARQQMRRGSSTAAQLGSDFFSPYSEHTRLVAEILGHRAAGDALAEQRLTSQLIEALDPLLARVAARLERQRGSLAVADLMQVGRIEVVKAIDTFNATRTQSFATLVWWTARGAMLDAVRLHSADVRPSLGAQKGRVKKVGITSVVVDSVDTSEDDRCDPELGADEQLANEQVRVLVRKFLHRLPQPMADLVRKVHGIGCEPVSLRDIARTTGENRAKLDKTLKRGEQLLGAMLVRATR
jgi:RNA polymerase sigma factor (sigma-70 family)